MPGTCEGIRRDHWSAGKNDRRSLNFVFLFSWLVLSHKPSFSFRSFLGTRLLSSSCSYTSGLTYHYKYTKYTCGYVHCTFIGTLDEYAYINISACLLAGEGDAPVAEVHGVPRHHVQDASVLLPGALEGAPPRVHVVEELLRLEGADRNGETSPKQKYPDESKHRAEMKT